MEQTAVHPRIVVGVDGSPLSVRALRWAVDQARLTDATVDVVTGYDIPLSIMVVPTYTEADYARDARHVLERSVADALGPEPDARVHLRLVNQRPARALTAAARGAALLVVGSHGHHGSHDLAGLHLGSVAGFCVHHAPCPVLVYRDGGPHDEHRPHAVDQP
ncbi:universal stress protein [Aquipuribacter sp. MA13-6]|uniref:universal stress protein n=1 Tax=unclassified Aquipuribacter TaxID=2635084 RepID=UPI003EF00D32